jgi:hypothetical protein
MAVGARDEPQLALGKKDSDVLDVHMSCRRVEAKVEVSVVMDKRGDIAVLESGATALRFPPATETAEEIGTWYYADETSALESPLLLSFARTGVLIMTSPKRYDMSAGSPSDRQAIDDFFRACRPN